MTDTTAPERLDRVPRLCYYELDAADGRLTKGDLVDRTGYSKRHITSALGTLVKVGCVQGVPRRGDGANEYHLRTMMQADDSEHNKEIQ